MKSKEFNLLFKLFKVCENREYIEVGNWIVNSQIEIMRDKLSEEEAEELRTMIKPNKKTNKTYQKLNKRAAFIENSKFDNICSVCQDKIKSGDPIFINGKNVWHPICATEEDKKDPKYFRWAKSFEEKTEEETLSAEQEYEDTILN